MREADYDTWDRLIAKPKKGVLPADQLITARGRGDTVAVKRHMAALPNDPRSVTYTTRYLWIYYEDDALAERAGQIGAQAGPAPARAATAFALAELDVARGRWHAARAKLAALPSSHTFQSQMFRRVCATMPFLDMSTEQLQSSRADLEAWAGDAPAGTDVTLAAAMPLARLYLLGLIHARLGENEKASDIAVRITQLPDPAGQPALADGLARTIRAQVAAQQGRHAEVVSWLEPVRGQVPLPLIRRKDVVATDYIFSQDHARFLRGRALREMGRAEEALPWLSTSFIGATGELVYRAPLHFELAQTYEAMGQQEKARDHYARFLHGWQNADAPQQRAVRVATQRFTRLGTEQ